MWINEANAKRMLHCEFFPLNLWLDFALFSVIGCTWSIFSRGRKFGVNDVERPTLYVSWTWCPGHADRSQVIGVVFWTFHPCKFPDSSDNDDQQLSSCKYGITEIQTRAFWQTPAFLMQLVLCTVSLSLCPLVSCITVWLPVQVLAANQLLDSVNLLVTCSC